MKIVSENQFSGKTYFYTIASRENGRTFVSGVMEEDGVDEERARRILKKAFALRFKVAMPEFDL